MQKQPLSGAWEFRQAGTDEWLPAAVPGGAHTDLLAAGRLPDPFTGDNERRVAWVAEADWEYRRRFDCPRELLQEEYISLVCDGLDTLATVTLNGQELGRADNMFRQYRWEVKELLKPAGNDLLIAFASPVKFCAAEQARRPLRGVSQAIPGGPHLRKAPCQFGWDWGPQLPPIGIWKDIRLEGSTTAWIEDVHLRQQHDGRRVCVTAEITAARCSTALIAALRLTAPDGNVLEATTRFPADQPPVTLRLEVPNPQLWWPNGYGPQPLYQAEVLLSQADTGQPLDRKTYQLGLRTIELRQEEDRWGRSFEFVVNGVRIFAKGANWIPADSFPTRISDEYLEGLIRDAAAAHMNMLRVWGGGFYEEERFYDICDRYGILVWQEFIFSCSQYPWDDGAFIENVQVEAEQNIRRLRQRASLALWCGNNEIEWGWVDWGWKGPEAQAIKDAYDVFFHHTLPQWVQALDPDTAYWPSSPSSRLPFTAPNGQQQGDAHYWDVWHGRKPFTAYRQQFPRFMSEFGFQALPPLATIKSYAQPADWNMTSYIMEQHQKNAAGNGLMIAQMTDTFRMPKDFPALVYLSMALQAEGIRYGVEHWRRHPDRVAGTLIWQLNDCWPVASWSSLDFFGRWKALHYAAKRFYAPVMLSIEDQPPVMGVYVTNDTLEPWEGELRWALQTTAGKTLHHGKLAVTAAPQACTHVGDDDFGPHLDAENVRERVFVVELWQDEARLALQTAAFVPPKHLALVEPGIRAALSAAGEALRIELEAQALARLVELSFEGAEVVFSDNYFDLPAGLPVTVTCPRPAGWSAEQAQAALRIRSLYDSYEH